MSNHFRDAFRLPITPTAGVPAFPANAVRVQKYNSQIKIYCDIVENGATGINHIIWGFLEGNNAPIVIQTLVNLDAIATQGKYAIDVPPPPVGGAWVGIAVQQTVAAGAPTTTVKAALS